MRIYTTTDIPHKTLRQQTFNGIDRAFLREKQELLMLCSQVEPSDIESSRPRSSKSESRAVDAIEAKVIS